jgi:hypothetical protein
MDVFDSCVDMWKHMSNCTWKDSFASQQHKVTGGDCQSVSAVADL